MQQTLLKKAEKYTFFTWCKQTGLNRKVISKAKGIYFWDEKDKRYMDFSSQLINVNLGHSNPVIMKAIQKQFNKLDYSSPSFVSKPKVQLAEQLAQLTSLSKTFFTTGGAEANENAIMIARQVSGKELILSREPSYHGATYATRTAGRDATRKLPTKYDLPFFQYFSAPKCIDTDPFHKYCCGKSVQELKSLVNKFRGKIAALIIEPIPGAQGVLIPSSGYLSAVVDICKKNNIIVIFDEVMTGFCRTGKWFSYMHWNVKPDIVTLSKGINGGATPLGAVVVSKKIASFFDTNPLLCGLTNSGHPISCAAGVEAIKLYKKLKLENNSAKMGRYLLKRLTILKEKYKIITAVRGIGLFGVIEFGRQRDQKFTHLADLISETSFKNGVYLYHRLNTIILAPPLIIKKTELNTGLNLLEKSIKECLVLT